MVLCLMELVRSWDSAAEEQGTDEEWTDLIDRGGLWYVKEFHINSSMLFVTFGSDRLVHTG